MNYKAKAILSKLFTVEIQRTMTAARNKPKTLVSYTYFCLVLFFCFLKREQAPKGGIKGEGV